MKIGCWRKGHSLSCPYCSSPLPSRSSFVIPQPDSAVTPPPTLALSFCLCLSIGVTTAAPRCVRKLECHVLTGVRGMLTGQTERTDGSVTCPRSSGMPPLGSQDLKPNTFFACFLFLSLGLLPLPPPPPYVCLSFFLSPPSLTSLSYSILCFSFHSRLSSACPVS